MDGHAEVFEFGGLGGLVVEQMHVFRQGQAARHAVGGVVVARDQVDGDVGVSQLDHLLDEEQPGVEILPVAVVEIAGDEDEGHGLIFGQVDEILQRPARGAPHFGRRGPVVAIQTAQGAIEMKIRRVDELEHHLPAGPSVPAGPIRCRERHCMPTGNIVDCAAGCQGPRGRR